MSKYDFTEKRRLHPIAAVLKAGKAFWNLVPFAVVALIGGGGDFTDLGPLLTAVLLPAGALVAGFVDWIRFRYWIEAGELRVTRGVLIHREVHIPLDHIQAVDVTVGVFQRLFGLVKLEVKSAAAGTQINLSAITRAEAQALEATLREASEIESTEEGAPGAETVWKLTPRQLLLAGATSGKLGVVFGGIAWLVSVAGDLLTSVPGFEMRADETIEQTIESGVPAVDPLLIAALAIGGLLVAWLVSVVWEAVTIGRFAVRRKGDRLVIRRGLVEQTEITLPVSRVQSVRIQETLLRRPFGYVTLYVDAVGHAEEKGQSSVLHPFLHRDQVETLLRDLLPFLNGEVELTRPPGRALIRFALMPSVVVTVAVAAAASLWMTTAWWGLLLLPAVWTRAWLRWRNAGAGFSGGLGVVRSGALLRKTAIFESRRIQAAETAANWFQRRRELADFGVTTASGAAGRTHSAPNLDREVAERLLRHRA